MKWIRFCSAIVATLGLTAAAQADIFDLFEGLENLGAGKSCGCASACQPESCKKTMTRPCQVKVHTYQRQVSTKKAPCCKPRCCAPAPKCCKPAPKCCAPKPTCCAKKCCGKKKSCCQSKCCQQKCCDADPCVIAKLIYKSQTACYAVDREAAIDELGDNYDCVCNPEIMVALIYALNDAVEDVREEAADEIGDQLRMNPCCCSKEVVAALKAALGDCDKSVRCQAEEALEACGYCTVCGCSGKSGEPVPAAPMDDKAAPMPPADPKAYFPSPLRPPRRSPLADLFGLLD